MRTAWGLLTALVVALALVAGGSAAAPSREILFVGQGPVSGSDVLSIRSDGTGLRLIAPGAREGFVPSYPQWSPDGSRVVFSDTGTLKGLFVVPAAGGPARRITTGVDLAQGWSRDGRWIAFLRSGRSVIEGVFVVRPDGSGLQRVWKGNTGHAVWAPGSKHLLVDARNAVAIVDLAGHVKTLPNSRCGGGAVVSPDDRWIALQRCDGAAYHTRIALVRSDGSRFHWISQARYPWVDAAPQWAPDGHSVAFQHQRLTDGSELSWIETVGVDGRHLRVLTHDERHDELPRWSPDGSQIVFDRDSAVEPIGEAVDLGVVDVATGQSRTIYHLIDRWTQSFRPR